MQAIDRSEALDKYRGQFVAFKLDRKTIVGHGKTLRSAKQAAAKNGCDNPIITRMPLTNRYFIGGV